MKNTKIILIHGNGGGTPHDSWFPFAKTEFEKMGLTVIARQFPDAMLAREQYWLPFLKDTLNADEQSILIGHSSGALAALRYAEKNKILGSVLVGAMHTDLGMETEILSGYYNRPFDWPAIAHNQEWIIQFASIDDPWIPIEEPRHIHEQLNTEYYEFTDRGHFGGDRIVLEFPELVAAVKEKLVL